MERHISKPLPPGWDILYAKYLSDHTAVGQNTARKYAAVMKQAAKKGVLDSEKLAKFSKEKNRFYVRAAIVSFIDFLEYNRLLDDGEAKDVLMGIPRVREKDAKPRELLTIEEVQNVMGRLEKEERLAAQFLFYTGCRISEAMAVRLADVNFQTGFVNVTGKGGKPRPVMLPPAYLKDLKKYLDEMGVLKLEGVFYPFSKSEPAVKSMMFNEKFRKACIDAVGRPVGSHEFRRIFATTLYEKTKDIQLVQQILGHTRMETTARYTKYARSQAGLKQAMEIIGAVDLMGKKKA